MHENENLFYWNFGPVCCWILHDIILAGRTNNGPIEDQKPKWLIRAAPSTQRPAPSAQRTQADSGQRTMHARQILDHLRKVLFNRSPCAGAGGRVNQRQCTNDMPASVQLLIKARASIYYRQDCKKTNRRSALSKEFLIMSPLYYESVPRIWYRLLVDTGCSKRFLFFCNIRY